MIEHLHRRDWQLRTLGWPPTSAEWVALVCLHSGVFTRSQFCAYFDAHRSTAGRFVSDLVGRRLAVEEELGLDRRIFPLRRYAGGARSRFYPRHRRLAGVRVSWMASPPLQGLQASPDSLRRPPRRPSG